MERRLQSVLSLANLNLARSNPVKEQGNGRCSVGMFIPLCPILGHRLVYSYSAWALVVARSTGKGNARA